MRKVLATISCLSLFIGTVPGADNPEDAALRGIRPEAIRAHVKFLADDLLEGRGTGTRGYDLASRYIAAQFEAMGLEPAGVNGTYYQPIRFRSAIVAPEETSLKLVRSGSEETLVWGQDYIALGSPRALASEFSGQVVYVGYGVTAPAFGIDDYKQVNARGKIIAYISDAPAILPLAERTYYSGVRAKMDNAATHGAIGAIRIWDPEGEKRQPFSRVVRGANLPSMSWLGENGFPNNKPDATRLFAILSEAGTKKLFEGPPTAGPLPVSIDGPNDLKAFGSNQP